MMASDGREILEALGVDLDGVVAATLNFKVGDVPTLLVAKQLKPVHDDEHGWITPIRKLRYQLVSMDDDSCPECGQARELGLRNRPFCHTCPNTGGGS